MPAGSSRRGWEKRAMLTRQAVPSLAPGDELLAVVTQRYRVGTEGVGRFLARNTHLVPVLLEIADVLPAYFGPKHPLSLKKVQDPEDGSDRDGDGELFAKVGISLPPVEALARLRAFDRAWWFPRLPRVGSLLTVTFEYV